MSILAAAAVPHPPLIMPEVGRGDERGIQATIDAYREVSRRIFELRPELVIVSSPHTTMYADYFHVSPGSAASGSFANFRAPGLKVSASYDTDFVNALERLCAKNDVPAGTKAEREPWLDHATMIPLRFLRDIYEENGIEPSYKVARVGLSGLSPAMHYKLGTLIAQTVALLNRRAVYIASGDLSHKLKSDGPYGFAKEGPVFDSECMASLGSGDFLRLLSMDSDLCEGAAECGLRSFWIMAGALDRKSVTAEQLSYEGPFGVGYGVAYFTVGGKDESRNIGEQLDALTKKNMAERKNAEDPYVKLARRSIESFVRTGEIKDLPTGIPDEITSKKAGAFVSLKKDGRLRGCIGTFLPTQPNLAMEIWGNAVSACSRDPRFSPVEEDELDDIVYSVDVLTEPEPIESEAELDPKVYGVIVSCGSRRGLLLPDLAGVDTVEEQISIARQKGGIRPNEKVTLHRFKVVRHH